ncbi:sensor histidine kinase [Arthrobacter pigmenti]
MISNNKVQDTALAGNTAAALGALFGVALGTASMLPAGDGLLLTTAALIAGFVAAQWKPPFRLIMMTTTTSLLAAMVCGLITDSWAGALIGLMNGAFYTLCLVAPVLIIAAVRGRRSYLQRGWDLAIAEAREQDARVSEAVTRERDAMASEIHDGLGHRITLIAVQAARLSLDDTLSAGARAELESIRANAAAASDEVGETVRLLGERTAGLTASLSGLDIEDVIERARASGLQVHTTIDAGVETDISDYARSALLRTLQEALTNAGKHAPDAEVTVAADTDGEWLELRVSNPLPDTNQPPGATPLSTAAASGNGLIALRHRVEILDGELHIDRGTDFTLTVRLPRRAAPTQAAAPSLSHREQAITAEGTDSGSRRRRAAQAAWLLPTALLAAALLAWAGHFTYANLASVLPAGKFAAIEVGDSREQAEEVLPPMEMLDAPRADLPVPGGAECEYYEASISFFERDDVYRICFVDNRVTSMDTISP